MRWWQVGVAGAAMLGAGVLFGPIAWATVITPRPDGRIVSPALVIRADGSVVAADAPATPGTPGPATSNAGGRSDQPAPIADPGHDQGAATAPSAGAPSATVGDATGIAPSTPSSILTGVPSTSDARPTAPPTTTAAGAQPTGGAIYPTTGPTTNPAPQTVQPTRVQTVTSTSSHDDDERTTSSRPSRTADKDDD